MLLGLAAWPQDFPKAEIAIDYSYMHFQAIDYKTLNFDFGRAYNLNGGGASFVYNFTRMFGFKAELQGYGSDTRSVFVPPGNPFLPGGGAANVNGDLFTYMLASKPVSGMVSSVRTLTRWLAAHTAPSTTMPTGSRTSRSSPSRPPTTRSLLTSALESISV